VLDAGLNSWTYAYDTNRCLTVMRDPLSRSTISNAYDAVGKVQSQMNGASNVWNFYISGWRGVEEDPQGGRTIHYFDDDGRNLGTQDALSNRTYNVYDAQAISSPTWTPAATPRSSNMTNTTTSPTAPTP
jgi:YD repeat-containing protein